MPLWPRPADETPPPDLAEISREVHACGRDRLPDWEAGYLEYHRRRYQDTLRLLPPGEGRRLLDVGSFPGHLSALAQARGWEVVGLNNAIEGGGACPTSSSAAASARSRFAGAKSSASPSRCRRRRSTPCSSASSSSTST